MTKTTRLAWLLSLGILSPFASADVLGLEVAGGYWQPDVDGDAVAGVDVDEELGIEDIGSAYIYAQFEHPIPLIPNIRVARTHIDKEGTGRLNTNFTFEGQNFVAGQVTRNKVDLSHTDITAYYEIIDTGGDLDVGLTARWFRGEVDINGFIEEAEIVLPMAYARAKADLPFTGFYVAGRVNAASYSGDSITDAEVNLGWTRKDFILPEFSAELGYRSFDIDVEESVFIDLDLSGVFINIRGDF